MSEDTRPLKRTRLDEQVPVASDSTRPTLQNLKHHEELWFDDGNLILIAGDTAFRIYRGLLASQSTVFSDMLLSSSASDDETLDGCPTVHLSDSPVDLAHFLRVLLPGSQRRFYLRDTDTGLSFDEVSAVIRLAHKYHVADVEKQALLFLQDYDFTCDFDRFVEREVKKGSGLRNDQSIGVVNLARLTNTPSLLPAALFRCSLLKEAVLDGWRREDGTVEQLSTEDLKKCFAARPTLIERNFNIMKSVFQATPSVSCQTAQVCRHGIDAYYSWLLRDGIIFKYTGVISWDVTIQSLAQRASVCPECEKELQARNARERRKFWEDLPKTFGITVEGWPSSGVAD